MEKTEASRHQETSLINPTKTQLLTPWLAVLPTAAASPLVLPPPSAPLTNSADVESACPAPAHTQSGYWSQPAVTTAPHLATFLSPVCPPASCSTLPSPPQAWKPSTSQPTLSPAVSPASQAAADQWPTHPVPGNNTEAVYLIFTFLGSLSDNDVDQTA